MQRRRRPRAVTLTLPDAEQPHLVLEGRRYTLRNFSQEGMGLWVSAPLPFGLHKGNQIGGDVEIGNHIHPVELEVVHHTPKTVGLRIKKMSGELRQIFQRLLEPSNYAATLMAQPESGKVDKETGFPRIWYEGLGGSELVVWYQDSLRVIKALQLCWLGKWCLRHQFQPVQTGHLTDETRFRHGVVVRDEELLVRDDQADPEVLHQAAQFLAAVNHPLPGHLLWQFLETGEQVYLPEEALAAIRVA